MTLYVLSPWILWSGEEALKTCFARSCKNGVSGKLPVAHTTVIMSCNLSLCLCLT
jgi:hypothetical protein